MRVLIKDDDGNLLAQVQITRVDSSLRDEVFGDYQVRFLVQRGKAIVGAYQRALKKFPRIKSNPLGFASAALKLLSDSELENENGADSPDLAWEQRRTRPTLPSQEENPFGDYGPAFWT